MGVDELVAEAEGRRLLYSYARGCDRLDHDLIASVFWPNGRAEMGAIYAGGVDGFVDVALGFMGGMAATRHDIGNVLFRHDGADALASEAYVQAWHRIETPGGTQELTVYGRYLTRFERRGGEWRIAWHSEVIDWGGMTAADAAWFEGNAEMAKGVRGREDASYGVV